MAASARSLGTALLIVGYPVATAAALRLVPMFRQRRRNRFLALEAGTACVVAGWAARGRAAPAVVNGLALAGLAAAWLLTGRRSGGRRRAD